MPEWHIRRAEARDAHALTACIHAAYADHAATFGNLPPLSTDYAEEIATCQVWIALIGSEIAGGLVIAPAEGFMQLANVAVHPDHRGRGMGKTLIALAEDQAVQQGYREIRLKTHAGMTMNIELYRGLEWRIAARQGDTVSMAKML